MKAAKRILNGVSKRKIDSWPHLIWIRYPARPTPEMFSTCLLSKGIFLSWNSESQQIHPPNMWGFLKLLLNLCSKFKAAWEKKILSSPKTNAVVLPYLPPFSLRVQKKVAGPSMWSWKPWLWTCPRTSDSMLRGNWGWFSRPWYSHSGPREMLVPKGLRSRGMLVAGLSWNHPAFQTFCTDWGGRGVFSDWQQLEIQQQEGIFREKMVNFQ